MCLLSFLQSKCVYYNFSFLLHGDMNAKPKGILVSKALDRENCPQFPNKDSAIHFPNKDCDCLLKFHKAGPFLLVFCLHENIQKGSPIPLVFFSIPNRPFNALQLSFFSHKKTSLYISASNPCTCS
jgi:hypothetical protein